MEENQIIQPEYTGFAEFTESLQKNWASNSEIRKGAADEYTSDSSVLLPMYNYIHYYKEDIKEMGLTDEFDALEKEAYELSLLHHAPIVDSEYQEKRTNVEKLLNKAIQAYETKKAATN